LSEHGDKIEASEKESIEAAIKDAEEAIKTGDKATLEAKSEALAQVSQKLGEKIYADAQAAAGAAGAAGAGAAPGGEAKKDDGDVVDAEFTEVKDKK
ncbi:MAG TPA: molecular chaperone DnaK, partial [Rhodocyclaceae bacterium]|nr:molecular chaperone DnaK [Rhodocyclaceae bacterium]